MADTTVTIKKDGTGDYTTIGSAVSASNVSSGFYKMVIDDSGEYSENVTLEAATGTPTSSNYMWLTVSSSNRHSGVHESNYSSPSHARLKGSSSYCLWLKDDYSRVEYLDMNCLNNTIMVGMSGDHTLMSRCIMAGNGADFTAEAIFVSGSGSRYIDNCLIQQFEQANYIQLSGVSANLNVYHDYCTFVDNGGFSAGSDDSNIYTVQYVSGYTLTCYLNNVGLADGTSADIINAATSNPTTFSGSHNAWDNDTSSFSGATNSLTNTQDISSGGLTATTTTANAMIVSDLTTWPYNYTPVEATGSGSNLLLGNGDNRQGSEPDSRQDFSTDIRGKARPTSAGKIDIGAFQITTVPGFKYWNGSAFVDTTGVQYWNGSAWVDVTGIQYYNGSAWTDPS